MKEARIPSATGILGTGGHGHDAAAGFAGRPLDSDTCDGQQYGLLVDLGVG